MQGILQLLLSLPMACCLCKPGFDVVPAMLSMLREVLNRDSPIVQCEYKKNELMLGGLAMPALEEIAAIIRDEYRKCSKPARGALRPWEIDSPGQQYHLVSCGSLEAAEQPFLRRASCTSQNLFPIRSVSRHDALRMHATRPAMLLL